ncbi:MAG: ABC-F family ATP-binding cassette domain-containing protein, partial [Bacteroidales bacterium]|nr:ABC-F family ATP-binding cassette domain-containing protein [Bacteroidales bacterium]
IISDRLDIESGEPENVRAAKTLLGLGFSEKDFDRPTETFSQGWNMRIELAKVLLSSPDILLLDEPTNHLDIESIEWLEDYLKAYRGAVIVVSHDRHFLDSVTSRTVEIVLGHVEDYKVPYSKYLVLREERLAQQKASYDNQQRMIEKTEDFINRFRYKPTKSNQVQSRIKALDKLERIEIDEVDTSAFKLHFPPSPRSGDVVFGCEDLTAGYDGKAVFSGATVEIRRGEKVAFVGRNGEGKTTLMRVIMGELEPMSGRVYGGHNVTPGYYAQNQEDILDGSDTVLGTLEKSAAGWTVSQLRDLLGAFLFRGDEIEKKVSVLSGGERARLGMAKLMLRSCNLLALDEPTNHMDIRSKDVLKEALGKYDGTLIVVSHDRDFLSGLVDKLYEVRDGRVREHLGDVSSFLQKRKLESLTELERKFPKTVAKKDDEAAKAFQKGKAESKERKKLLTRVAFLEKKVSSLEDEMSGIEKRLASPGENDDILELTRSYLEKKLEKEAFESEWVELAEKI